MDAFQLCLLLSAICCGMLAVACWDMFRKTSRSKLLILVVLLLSSVAICFVGAELQKGQPFDESLRQTLLEGKPKTLIIAFAGLIAGTATATLSTLAQTTARPLLASVATAVALTAAVATGLIFAWDHAFDIERFQPTVFDSNYTIDELAQTEQMPIRLALNEEQDILYYSTYSTDVNGIYGGSIFALSTSLVTSDSVPRVVASSPALYRTFGMTFHEGDLYVSRAGHAANAMHGIVSYANMGAVTQLKDLDGDGQFEYLHDIIDGIPAAQAPDTMHQNNGIAFDKNGHLFVAVGSADDRSFDSHEWSGTVLKKSPLDEKPEVFARGLRNPFGICCVSPDALFVTDNDCSANPGDEVNYVTTGNHYGHPISIPGDIRATGFRDPVLVGENSNYCGVCVVPLLQDTASQYHVFVCDRLRDSVIRLTVRLTDEDCNILKNEIFARVPTPVDIVSNERGELFVASLLKKKLYRIRLRS